MRKNNFTVKFRIRNTKRIVRADKARMNPKRKGKVKK